MSDYDPLKDPVVLKQMNGVANDFLNLKMKLQAAQELIKTANALIVAYGSLAAVETWLKSYEEWKK